MGSLLSLNIIDGRVVLDFVTACVVVSEYLTFRRVSRSIPLGLRMPRASGSALGQPGRPDSSVRCLPMLNQFDSPMKNPLCIDSPARMLHPHLMADVVNYVDSHRHVAVGRVNWASGAMRLPTTRNDRASSSNPTTSRTRSPSSLTAPRTPTTGPKAQKPKPRRKQPVWQRHALSDRASATAQMPSSADCRWRCLCSTPDGAWNPRLPKQSWSTQALITSGLSQERLSSGRGTPTQPVARGDCPRRDRPGNRPAGDRHAPLRPTRLHSNCSTPHRYEPGA